MLREAMMEHNLYRSKEKYCPKCNKETTQKLNFNDPYYPDILIWECLVCHETIDFMPTA